jgi:hypothetical protein
MALRSEAAKQAAIILELKEEDNQKNMLTSSRKL